MLKKKLTALLLALALVPTTAFAAPAAVVQQTIKVNYNAKAIVFPDQKPVIRDQRTLVPIRPIAESLGFQVGWNEQTRTVSVVKADTKVNLVVSQKIAKRNGETIQLDVPAQIINKRTMVPVRFIAEALNYQVNWEAKTQTVLIADQQQTTQPAAPTQTPTPTQPQQPSGQTANATATLFEKDTVLGQSLTIGTLGMYRVKGTVKAGSTVLLQMEDKNYEVPVKEDGSFELIQEAADGISDYTLKATLNNETEIFEGEFE